MLQGKTWYLKALGVVSLDAEAELPHQFCTCLMVWRQRDGSDKLALQVNGSPDYGRIVGMVGIII